MSGHMRISKVFIHTRIKARMQRKMQCNLFIKSKLSNAKRKTTANYRHTESLLYYYLKDEASRHTHTRTKTQ